MTLPRRGGDVTPLFPAHDAADDGYCTEAWVAQEFKRAPELFAEWAIDGGIDGRTRRQFKGTEESARGHA